MATILELGEAMEAILHDDSIWKGAVELIADKVVDVNKQELLDGRGNDGLDLPPYKAYTMPDGEQYGDLKQRLNSRNRGLWDMNYTGASFASMKGYFEGDQFRITGEGFAAAYHRQGVTRGRIFGINPQSQYMEPLRQKYLYPLLRQLIRARLRI